MSFGFFLLSAWLGLVPAAQTAQETRSSDPAHGRRHGDADRDPGPRGRELGDRRRRHGDRALQAAGPPRRLARRPRAGPPSIRRAGRGGVRVPTGVELRARPRHARRRRSQRPDEPVAVVRSRPSRGRADRAGRGPARPAEPALRVGRAGRRDQHPDPERQRPGPGLVHGASRLPEDGGRRPRGSRIVRQARLFVRLVALFDGRYFHRIRGLSRKRGARRVQEHDLLGAGRPRPREWDGKRRSSSAPWTPPRTSTHSAGPAATTPTRNRPIGRCSCADRPGRSWRETPGSRRSESPMSERGGRTTIR